MEEEYWEEFSLEYWVEEVEEEEDETQKMNQNPKNQIVGVDGYVPVHIAFYYNECQFNPTLVAPGTPVEKNKSEKIF